jgi:hypothetical protein
MDRKKLKGLKFLAVFLCALFFPFLHSLHSTKMSSTSYTLDMVSCTSKAYDEISQLVHNAAQRNRNAKGNDWCIVSIDKVKHPYLEEQFAAAKAKIAKERGKVEEVRAFHGTTEAGMAGILAHGFNPAFNVTSAYGKGTYVAPSASFARTYARENHMGDNVMILCRVALGVRGQGYSNLHLDTTRYDYGVDNLKAPNMYVIPYRYAVIPEYVVQFYGKATA